VALAIDWVLVSVAMSTCHAASGDLRIYPELMNLESVNFLFWITLSALVLYTAFFEGMYGRTPGKYLAGLRVRSVLGGPPAWVQAVIRNVLRAVDMFPTLFPGIVGAVAALFNVRRQRVGDMLAATMVRRHLPLRYRKFLLASASPRRLELLSATGFDIRVEPQDVDEGAVRGEAPEDTARMLAEAKGRAAAETVSENFEIVVAADTVVVLDGEILGKPRDAADASRMLNMLSGRSHTVITGVMIWDPATGQALSDAEYTEVEFRRLSQGEIDEYVATGDPMDKAGAYGVQTGHMVKEIRGSLSNVAGLPMELLQGMLSMLDS
jgi:septum formation protein